MSQLRQVERWRRPRVLFVAVVLATTAALTLGPSAGALDCEGMTLDDGCLFTITAGDTDDPDDGFAVTNADGVPLWDFTRARDLQAIGYPISQRWGNGPFTLQAFQKVILQWDPGKARMNYYNTLDVLANRYPEVELPNVPPHQVLEADRGVDFATITQNHLALLDQNAAIKARFLGEPDWLNLYGLPIRYEEREVDGHPQGLQMLRAQRTVLVIWNVPAPGVTVGRVNLQNVPDKVKKLSNVIIPDAAKAPIGGDAVPASTAPTPAATEAPMPTRTPTPASAPTPTTDREVLIRLFHATDGPNWTNSTNWLSDAPLDDWHGVVMTDGRITELRLADNNLGGELPWRLGYLPHLEILDLDGNKVGGALPPELGRLTKLKEIFLGSNRLGGAIPIELGRLTNLRFLYLGENRLSGPIPSELGSLGKLEYLSLDLNRLTGTIPVQLGNLANLTTLVLASNRLSGAIPSELGSLAKLNGLYLAENQLTGVIPPEVSRLSNLEWIWLSNNQLSGKIPPELGRLANLRGLWLDHNRLRGAIPSELGNLSKLRELYLQRNQLRGPIPPALGRLTNLRELYLSWNQLSGAIPLELGSLANVERLFLGGGNRLTGCIPDGLRDVNDNDFGSLELAFCEAG